MAADSGGAAIAVAGAHFEQDASTSCIVGGVLSAAVFVSPQELRCRVPPLQSMVAAGGAWPLGEANASSLVSVAIGEATALGTTEAARSPTMLRVIADSEVLSLVPSSGPARGGTLVTVVGTGFTANETVGCVFGDAGVAPAEFLNSTAVACQVPELSAVELQRLELLSRRDAAGPAGSDAFGRLLVGVAVTGPAGALSRTRAAFALETEAQPKSVFPAGGPLGGATAVRVSGRGFAGGASLACRFGSFTVPARRISEFLVECSSPSAASASDQGRLAKSSNGVVSVPVSVSNNGVDFAQAAGLAFHYYPAPTGEGTVSSRPSVLPRASLVSGGSLLALQGRGFAVAAGLLGASAVRCRVGKAELPAALVDDGLVTCTAPPAWQAGLAAAGERAAVAVSLNGGADWHPLGAAAGESPDVDASVLFLEPAVVSSLTPPAGPPSAATRVRVLAGGSALSAHEAGLPFMCSAGDALASEAQVVAVDTAAGTLTLECVLPPRPARVSVGSVAAAKPSPVDLAPVRLSFTNGSDWGPATAHFAYVEPPTLESVWPPALGLGSSSPSSSLAGGAPGAALWALGRGFLPAMGASCLFYGPARNATQQAEDAPELASAFAGEADQRQAVAAPPSLVLEGRVPATWVSASQLLCSMQNADFELRAGAWQVAVAYGDAAQGHGSIVSERAPWQVLDRVAVLSAAPRQGSPTGGVAVRIRASGPAVGAADAVCRFGVALVPAVMVVTAEGVGGAPRPRGRQLLDVWCVSPALALAAGDAAAAAARSDSGSSGVAVELALSLDGGSSFSTAPSPGFTFAAPAALRWASPLSALSAAATPSMGGDGSVLTLRLFSPLVGFAGQGGSPSPAGESKLAAMRAAAASSFEGLAPELAAAAAAFAWNASSAAAALGSLPDPLPARPTCSIDGQVVPALYPGTPPSAQPDVDGDEANPLLYVDCMVPFRGQQAPAFGAGSLSVSSQQARRLTVSVATSVQGHHAPEALGFGVDAVQAPLAESVAPRLLPSGQATAVRVSGSGFANSGRLSCRVSMAAPDGSRVHSAFPAVWVSPTSIRCSVRPVGSASAPYGPALLSVSNDGLTFVGTTGAGPLRLTFATPPEVHAVSPPRGTVAGGTLVTVSGRGFGPGAQCVFGSVRVAAVLATRAEGESLSCLSPPGSAVGDVVQGAAIARVEVAMGEALVSASRLSFEWEEPASASLVVPFEGPVTGGSTVLVLGSGFSRPRLLSQREGVPAGAGAAAPASSADREDPGTACWCRFGSGEPVRARWLSDSALACTTPDSEASDGEGEVDVLVSTNGGGDWSSGAASFVFTPAPRVARVDPKLGPASRGGTLVTVRGSGFLNSAELACMFGDAQVPAYFVDERTLLCRTPPLAPGAVPVRVTTNGLDWSGPSATDSLRTAAVAAAAGLDAAAVAAWHAFTASEQARQGSDEAAAAFGTPSPLEQFDFGVDIASGAGLPGVPAFRYLPDESVWAARPARSLLQGGVPITVLGSGFVNSTSLECAFGELRVRAIFLTPTSIICPAPSRALVSPVAATTVALRVANNGVDFTRGHVSFEYVGSCPPGHYCAGRAILRAPNGTFAAGYGSTNFTLCEPGTFQPRTGQSACLPCPVGYFCPDHGLSAPRLCRAGMVCDSHGLRVPVKPCPAGHFCPPGTKSDDPLDFRLVAFRTHAVEAEAFAIAGPRQLLAPRLPGIYEGTDGLDVLETDEWQLLPEFGLLSLDATKRDWEFRLRPYPEDGFHLLEMPPPGFDRTGLRDLPHIYAERPHPCPLGYYCRTGAATNETANTARNFSAPQRCFSGFFCPRGSVTPEGQGPCPTGHYCPTPTEAFICPVGHYCPEVGNTRPLECYPGTYNPLTKRSNCTLCPPGHICPRWGMLEPEICPAGFVCVESGLPEPVLLCPPGFYCEAGSLTLNTSLSVPPDPMAPPYIADYLPGFDDLLPYGLPDQDYFPSGVLGTPGQTSHSVLDEWAVLTSGTDDVASPFSPAGQLLGFRPTERGRKLAGSQYGTIDDDMTAMRASVLASLVSGPAAPTFAAILAAPLKPIACMPGTFCLGGVASNRTLDWVPANGLEGARSPQTCTEGTFCRYATTTAAGTQPCFPGHYCYPGSTFPTEAPLGTFSSAGGSVAPTLCFPGTYAPLLAHSECRVCPAGYSCAGYGTYEPTICGVGTYRSLADSITCRLCPQGTYSQFTGLTDVSDCEPCPPGRVCGEERMTNLTRSTPCPDGHACGTATTKGKQFDHTCPAGHYCFEETSVDEQVDFVCEAGHYCPRATKGFLKTRNKCAVQYYCPEGTTEGFPAETKCPTGTTSKSGVTRLTDCEVTPVKVCDKDPNRRYYPTFEYTLNGDTEIIADGENEVEVLRHIDPVNQSSSVPFWRNDTIVVQRVCPSLAWVDAAQLFEDELGALRPGLLPPGGLANATLHAAAGRMLTVVGRNFLPGSGSGNSSEEVMPTMCSFTVISPESGVPEGTMVFTQAIVESQYRLYCSFPDFGLGRVTAATDILVNVSVLELGGEPAPTGPATQLLLSRTREGLNDTAYEAAELALCSATLEGEGPIVEEDLAPIDRWFSLRGLSMAHLTFDFRHLPEEFVYSEHFRVAISVIPSVCTDERCDAERVRIPNTPNNEHLLETSPCKHPIQLSPWFESSIVAKRTRLNVSILALEDVLFRVELHLLYGLFLPVAHHLANTSSVQIASPSLALNSFRLDSPPVRELAPWVSAQRRRVRDEHTFVAIFKREFLDSVSAPLNLPPRFQDLERGRVLPMFNVSTEADAAQVPWIADDLSDVSPGPEYWNPPAAGAQLLELIDKYREIFQETPTPTAAKPDVEYAFSRMLLPYLPYLSNCKGFDSYVPIFALTEGEECSLPPEGMSFEPPPERLDFPPFPHPDDIRVVDSLDFFQSPIADVCFQRLLCKFEENLPQKDVNPRWFEASGGTELFQILRNPTNLEGFFRNGLLLDEVEAQFGIDSFIPVSVDREAADSIQGECTRLCFPRVVRLEISYYQTNASVKRIIGATLVFDEFDRDTTLDRYVFEVLYYPLNYIELVVAFAFERNTFIFLFTIVGFLALAATIVYWAGHRLIARSTAARFKYGSFLKIVTTPPLFGVALAIVPIAIIVFGIYILMNGEKLLWPDKGPDDVWPLDAVVGHYMQSKVDPRLTQGYRRGRIGLCFLVMALYLLFVGSRIFVPRLVSKREREIERSRDQAAEEENTWTPTLWKRSHMLLTSILFALFLTVVVEFSFWEDYGTYIWYIIVALKVVAIFADITLGLILKEALLVAPLSTAMGIVQSMVTLGAADFADFLLAFAIEFGLAVAERVYIGPFLAAIINFVMASAGRAAKFFRSLIKLTRRKTLEEELLEEEKQATRVFKEKEREIEIEGQATVEPILDAFGSYANETVALLYSPILIAIFIFFRTETEIPNLYNIREQDMEYYLWFALIISAFQLCSDIFQLNVLEMFHQWQIFDYLTFTQYHFLQREARWIGMGEKLDECVEESLRTLNQMFFSSQFYFMNFLHASGIIFFIIGLEIIIRARYNFFGDPAALFLVPAILIACRIVRSLLTWFANRVGIWRMKNAGLAWHADLEQDEDDDGVPKLDDLEKMRGATHEQFIMNQKITSETFRYKFLDYNREWLVANLPKLLTPRTLRRSRPYLIAQFAKILGTVNDDISSDSSSDDDVTRRFGPVDVSPASRTLVRMWLNLARRRLRLKDVVRPWITRQPKEVQSELLACVDPLGDRFEKAHPNMEEFDQVAWKRFFEEQAYPFLQQQRDARAAKRRLQGATGGLGDDEDEADGPRFGAVFLRPAAKKMVTDWMREARARLRRRRGERVREDVSDDDEDEDDLPTAEWAKQPLNISSSTKALAARWLQLGRHSLYSGGGKARRAAAGLPVAPGRGGSRSRRK